MRKSLQKEKGFTLIELMIVCVVLAILITTVVLAQKSVLVRSKNTRILTAVEQVRKIAGRMYINPGSYENLCSSQGGHLKEDNADFPELKSLQVDINNNGGATACYSALNSYCVSTKLFDNSYFCIDDEGYFENTSTTSKCANPDTTCH